mmetsp:Transcript_38309/g.77312  ORF Transcript_38309/g.77312 Transcript_38309/m.77312 type:complete len:192 (+) Transcript_38309:162-737(+)
MPKKPLGWEPVLTVLASVASVLFFVLAMFLFKIREQWGSYVGWCCGIMMGIYGAPDIPKIRFKIIMSKEALISLSRRNPLFVCSAAVTLLVLVVGGALTDGGVVGGAIAGFILGGLVGVGSSSSDSWWQLNKEGEALLQRYRRLLGIFFKPFLQLCSSRKRPSVAPSDLETETETETETTPIEVLGSSQRS